MKYYITEDSEATELAPDLVDGFVVAEPRAKVGSRIAEHHIGAMPTS